MCIIDGAVTRVSKTILFGMPSEGAIHWLAPKPKNEIDWTQMPAEFRIGNDIPLNYTRMECERGSNVFFHGSAKALCD